MKILISLSEVMYRGEGQGSNSSVIEWLTPDVQHAEGYARYREGSVRDIDLDLKKERVISMSHDSMILTPQEFSSRALRQVPRKRVTAKRDSMRQAHNKFLEYFNVPKRMPVMDYWKSEQDKVAVRDLLVAYGFTVIRVQESKSRVETYGRLKK